MVGVITGLVLLAALPASARSTEMSKICALNIIAAERACSPESSRTPDATANDCQDKADTCYRSCQGSSESLDLRGLGINRYRFIDTSPIAVKNCREAAAPYFNERPATFATTRPTIPDDYDDIKAHSACVVKFASFGGDREETAAAALNRAGDNCRSIVCATDQHQAKSYCQSRGGQRDEDVADDSSDKKDEKDKVYEDLKKIADNLEKKQKSRQDGNAEGGGGAAGGGIGGDFGGGGFSGSFSGSAPSGAVKIGSYDLPRRPKESFGTSSLGSNKAVMNPGSLARAIRAAETQSITEAANEPVENPNSAPAPLGVGQGVGMFNSGSSGDKAAAAPQQNDGRNDSPYAEIQEGLGGDTYMAAGPGVSFAPGNSYPAYSQQVGQRVSQTSLPRALGSSNQKVVSPAELRNLLKSRNLANQGPQFGSSDTNLFSSQSSLFEQIINQGILDENGNEF